MDALPAWLGDLNAVEGLPGFGAGLICVLVSTACGAAIGLEREARDKPAGLRTVLLIAIGSTIYTLISLRLGAAKPQADPARLAAQIVPGIGFLGAGAIMRARGHVVGLTTGATIWAVAAVGVAAGAGYAAAAVGFTALILFSLTALRRLEWMVTGPCRHQRVVVRYGIDAGRSRPRLLEVLDRYHTPERQYEFRIDPEGNGLLALRYCAGHREHRSVLRDLAEIPAVTAIETPQDTP